jgi:hypothetical protein
MKRFVNLQPTIILEIDLKYPLGKINPSIEESLLKVANMIRLWELIKIALKDFDYLSLEVPPLKKSQ